MTAFTANQGDTPASCASTSTGQHARGVAGVQAMSGRRASQSPMAVS